jgi:predicted PurR-regulated permease PerM
MPDAYEQSIAPWIRFGGFVLVIAVLYWAQVVLVPVALALLITFVLSPPVAFLQRRIGRILAVLITVALVFTTLGLAGWGVATQMSKLAGDLPRYRANIRQKVSDIRGATRGGSMEQVQETVNEIRQEAAGPRAPIGNAREPVIVQSQQVSSLTDFPSWLAPYPLLWAALGAALRFVPYLGPIAAAAGPILVSLAALPGWTRPLSVVGLFVSVELFTNLVLETILYAGAAGVSQVALLVAVASWT